MKNLGLLLAVLLVTAQTSLAQVATATAIKASIERETQSWLNVDAKTWAGCWANVPEARLHYSETNGKVHQIKMPEGMAKMLANQKPSKATFKNTNYQIRVKGDAAFAQFDQEFSNTDGSKEYARETRYLEKDGAGAWKIVHVGAMYYQPAR